MEIAVFVIMMATGQLLFKSTSNSIVENSQIDRHFMHAILGWKFITAVSLYGAATFLWLRILKSYQLSTAYPIAMGTTITVTSLASIFLFQDQITTSKALGVGMMVASIFLISS